MVITLCKDQDIVQGHLCTKCGLRWVDNFCLIRNCSLNKNYRVACPECKPNHPKRAIEDRPGEWWYVHNGQKVDEFEAWVLKTRSNHGKAVRIPKT